MAKQTTQSAKQTRELPGIPAKRGRPSTGKALSAADRMKAYRRRKFEAQAAVRDTAIEYFDGWTNEQLRDALLDESGVVFQGAWVELGRRSGWLK